MRREHLLVTLLVTCLAGGGVSLWAKGAEGQSQKDRLAQARREKAERLEPPKVSSWEERARRWEKARFPMRIFTRGFRGIRPLLGGMPSGSGQVFGAGYIHGLESEYIQFEANARYSTRHFTQFDTLLRFPTPQQGRRVEGLVRAAYEDYVDLRFYGLGNDSDVDDESYYGQLNKYVRGGLDFRPLDRLTLGFEAGRLNTRTDSGRSNLSIEDVFDPDSIPGFDVASTDYNIFGGKLRFDLLDFWEFPPVGADLLLEGWRYENVDGAPNDFTRFVGQLRFQVPLGPRNRRLAFKFHTVHDSADDGHEVPFYLMSTVGGANTIRGFSEYRFRDRRTFHMMLEYRWEVWTYVDFAFFIDAGKAFDREDDFNFEDLHKGGGFGVRLHAPGNIFFNMDLAYSTEGVKFHIGGGPRF